MISEKEGIRVPEGAIIPDHSPKKYGKWLKISPAEVYECDQCGQKIILPSSIDKYNYCFNCGAQMSARWGDGKGRV